MNERTITVKALPDYPGYKYRLKNDRKLTKDLHTLLSQCDICIAHNGDAFDLKKAHARFLYHKMKPPPAFRSVDTLKILRKHFKLTSNKLDHACGVLGIGRKLPHTGKHLWLGCMRGEAKAWRKMRRYNAHDVRLLSTLYHYIRPWATNLPDLNLYAGTHGRCPSCLSSNVIKHGFSYARSIIRQRFQCKDCGSWHVGERLKGNTLK